MVSIKLVAAAVAVLVALTGVAVRASPGGTQLWQFNFPTPQLAVNPTIFGDIALVPTNTTLYTFNATTGDVLWTFDYNKGDSGGYAAADAEHGVYVGCISYLYALTWTGKPRWGYSNPDSNSVVPMRPSIGQDGVYLTTGASPVIKFRHEDGVIQWISPTSLGIAQLHAREEASGTYVYVVSQLANGNSVALCLSAKTGAYQWNVSGVVTIIVSNDMGLLLCQGGSATTSTLTAVQLFGGTSAYTLTYAGSQALDYYTHGSHLYVDIGATPAPYPTTLLQYSGSGGNLLWQVRDVSFLYFIPCSAGIVVFGAAEATAYSKDSGSVLWRYGGVAVNDGAATASNVILMLTSTSVVALQF